MIPMGYLGGMIIFGANDFFTKKSSKKIKKMRTIIK